MRKCEHCGTEMEYTYHGHVLFAVDRFTEFYAGTIIEPTVYLLHCPKCHYLTVSLEHPKDTQEATP